MEYYYIHGGSWRCKSENCKITYQRKTYPFYRLNYIGFRLIKKLK